MVDNTSRIPVLLKEVRLLNDKYQELAAVTGEDFNVFSILGVQTDEVKTHSALLAELLNPRGSHHQGSLFLKLFLKLCLQGRGAGDGEYAFEGEVLEDFRVGAEVATDQGRIDILLEKDDACIVIENKIYAADQEHQLNRYYQYALGKNFEKDRRILIYLTLDGSEPGEYSLGDLDRKKVLCISYREHITRWLEECMRTEEVQRIAPIREIFFQYRNLLKDLTGQPTNRRYVMELVNLLKREKNYELIKDLNAALCELQTQLQLKFWKELEAQIKEIDLGRSTNQGGKEATEENIRKYYAKEQNSKHLGLTFSRQELPKGLPAIRLRVELDSYGWVFYGFVLFENFSRVAECKDVRFDNFVAGLKFDEKFTRNDWWFAWKYPEKDLLFNSLDKVSERDTLCWSNTLGSLLDENECKDLVKGLVDEITGHILDQDNPELKAIL
ncbi:MAG: PD-(D/E)XK nuclease family protein [Halieaceae bacterium]|nr:PD-(D/E)XK nuclease family protein [Halieaceae bacterium]